MPLFIKGDQQVLFIHIPKTAGTSIEDAFIEAGWARDFFYSPAKQGGGDRSPCNPQHYHNMPCNRFIRKKHLVTDEFTIVRHPFTRLISEMMWKNRGLSTHINTRGYDARFFEKLEKFAISNFNSHIKIDKIFLENPAVFLDKKKKFHSDNHFRPQHEFIGKKTKVFRYEDLNDTVWNILKHQYNLNQLEKKNMRVDISKTRPTKFINPSDEFKQLYLKLYTEDHTQFNYELPF